MRRLAWLGLLFGIAAQAQTTNSWINAASGKWETPSNWSLGVAPLSNNQATVVISNDLTKTVTIDATTAGNTGLMMVTNLFVQGVGSSINTLQITDVGSTTPFRVLQNLVVGTNSVLSVSNSVLQAGPGITPVSNLINGVVNILSSGVYTGNTVYPFVGSIAGRSGTLTASGKIFFNSGTLTLGQVAGSTGTVWVTGSDALVGFSDGTLSVGEAGVGQLTVSNGALQIGHQFIGRLAGARGTMTIAGGTNTVSTLNVGNLDGSTGTVWLTGGHILGSTVRVGNNLTGVGELIISNGTMQASNFTVGVGGAPGTLTMAGGQLTVSSTCALQGGAVWMTGGKFTALVATSADRIQFTIATNATFQGTALNVPAVANVESTLNIVGGTNSLSNALSIGLPAGSTGTLWMSSGFLAVSNSSIRLGSTGIGRATISNETVHAAAELISNGTLTMAGGTNVVLGNLQIADFAGTTGTVWITGGHTIITNGFVSLQVGVNSVGRMTLSNGTVIATNVFVGLNSGARGTLTQAGGLMQSATLEVAAAPNTPSTMNLLGGTNRVFGALGIGTAACTGTGTVLIAGGALYVTNTPGTAKLEVRSGTLTFNSGTLVVNTFVMTNACASFARTGGTLLFGTAVLDPARDDDGDGLSNGYEQANGLDPLNPFDDADGDGQGNLQELLAGTNPTNAASFFGITAIAREGNDIRVTWMTAAGKTNALERTAGVAGSFTNNFTGLTNIITTGATTNALDIGAATNVPAFYYRVRLVP